MHRLSLRSCLLRILGLSIWLPQQSPFSPISVTYFSAWFDNHGGSVQDPPPDCVADCSAQGGVDEAVDHWVRKLSFEAPAWLLRRYLAHFGAWDHADLCDHRQNLRRLLWTRCCDIREACATGDEPCPLCLHEG